MAITKKQTISSKRPTSHSYTLNRYFLGPSCRIATETEQSDFSRSELAQWLRRPTEAAAKSR